MTAPVTTGQKRLHVHTPLVHSRPISQLIEISNQVYLKMDNTQPSGSFKIRGHGHLVSTCHSEQGIQHFISSSGGNAGAAVAYAGRVVGARVTIVVPTSTPKFMQERLRADGADVIVHGDVWDISDRYALSLAENDPYAKHVSPFDDPLLWAGHATLIDEIAADLGRTKPSAVVVSVGGGGLFLGVAEGLRNQGWDDVPIIAAETIGADSFAKMAEAGGKVVRIDGITSIAKSLGALAVSEKCAEWVRNGRDIVPIVVSDKEAVEACSLLAVKHRVLVEPACGAAVAAISGSKLKGRIQGTGPVVVVICGGNMVSPGLLKRWVEETGAHEADL